MELLVTQWPDLQQCQIFRSESRGAFRLPDRTRVWRWEQAVTDFCQNSPLISEFVGVLLPDNLWHTVAQDKQLWKSCEQPFVWSMVVRPRGNTLSVENEDPDSFDIFLRALEDVQLSSE